MVRQVGVAVGVVAASLWLAVPASAQLQPYEVAGLGLPLSGDELTVNGQPIRLDGIAAPLPGQTCKNRYGREYDCYDIAIRVLTALVGERVVTCRIIAEDRTGQPVARCSVLGVDLGGAMVARGWAFAYRSLGHDYTAAEVSAQRRRRGMWAGQIEKPWQWRSRMQREQRR